MALDLSDTLALERLDHRARGLRLDRDRNVKLGHLGQAVLEIGSNLRSLRLLGNLTLHPKFSAAQVVGCERHALQAACAFNALGHLCNRLRLVDNSQTDWLRSFD